MMMTTTRKKRKSRSLDTGRAWPSEKHGDGRRHAWQRLQGSGDLHTADDSSPCRLCREHMHGLAPDETDETTQSIRRKRERVFLDSFLFSLFSFVFSTGYIWAYPWVIHC